MKYYSLSYSQSYNVGDQIQSLAAEQFLPRVDGFVDRDDGLDVVPESSLIILQGWFKHLGSTHWPPNDLVRPVFFGFHAHHVGLLNRQYLDYYRRWAPIGCRDLGTANMLRERGVDSYVSGDLTLTLPARASSPQQGRVYIVEGGVEALDRRVVPPELLRTAVFRSHCVREENRTNEMFKRFEAHRLLAEYRDCAELVVTNLLHCALACVAMGVPVVFLQPHDQDYPRNRRLDPLRGFVPLHDQASKIDWDPRPPDVFAAAEEMRGKIRQAIDKACSVS